jgi:hypothetical protein
MHFYFCFLGEDTASGPILPGPFFTGKILNRYNYRFYGPKRKKILDELKEKRRNGVDEEDQGGEKKKKIVRLSEVYCVNKKKFWSEASVEELAAPLELVPGGDNDRVHQVIQCKLR